MCVCRGRRMRGYNFRRHSSATEIEEQCGLDSRISVQISKSIKTIFLLFSEPFYINVENAREDLRLELIDMQCNYNLNTKFETVRISEMFKYLRNNYLKLQKRFSNILAMFGSSHILI